MASSTPGRARAGTPVHRAGASGMKGRSGSKVVKPSGKVNNSAGTAGKKVGSKSVPFSTGGPTNQGKTSATSGARKVTTKSKLMTPASTRKNATGTKNNASAVMRKK